MLDFAVDLPFHLVRNLARFHLASNMTYAVGVILEDEKVVQRHWHWKNCLHVYFLRDMLNNAAVDSTN